MPIRSLRCLVPQRCGSRPRSRARTSTPGCTDRPVGILVGGYDAWASYGYPGGMGISALWEPPAEPPG
jgi:hypothetical protein